MKTSLTLNSENQIALFYDEPLGINPEWASLDIDQGEIYIGSNDIKHKAIKLDEIDKDVYERVKDEPQILLVRVEPDQKNEPIETIFVPLMISRQL